MAVDFRTEERCSRESIRDALRTMGRERTALGARVFSEHPNNNYFMESTEVNDGRDTRPIEEGGRCFIGYMGDCAPNFTAALARIRTSDETRDASSLLCHAYESPKWRGILQEECANYLSGLTD